MSKDQEDPKPEQEPWYEKQLKDPTGVGGAKPDQKILAGCLSMLLIAVVVIFAIYAVSQ